MLNNLKSALKRHRSEEDGALTPEALVFMMLLIWAYTAMFVFWDAYKTENLVVKATYTVADMISRQTDIDNAFVEGANSIFGFLSGSDPTNELRVTLITMRLDPQGNPVPDLDCSYATGTSWAAISDLDMIDEWIPITAVGDQLIVVEGLSEWQPTFEVGLPGRNLYEIVVTKSRNPGRLDCDGFVAT